MLIDLNRQLENLSGYKISDSHFRLGSKIHIADFYYAKRFFQNHFFASRFAFMLSKEIIELISRDDVWDGFNKNNGITLVGYGVYSELLISLVEKFIKDSGLTKISINHNIIEDTQDLKPLKRDPFSDNIIIIVPIASTFSTSIKIEQAIRKIKKGANLNIFDPHFNFLYIADGEETNKLSIIEEEFGWKEKNIKEKWIKISINFDNDILPLFSDEAEEKPVDRLRKQRYFLSLPSVWNRVENCSDCFPEDSQMKELPLKEKPLFETDRTAVTPTSIFGYPKAREISKQDQSREYLFTPDMVRYGHHTRNNHHLIYSVNTELFLKDNLSKVKDWLISLYKDSKNGLQSNDIDRVLLVSSCHYSNINFINLVNEILYNSSANILHFDPSQDYIENFKLIYGMEIGEADKIIFVDDSLKSGTTLTKIDEFINYVLIKQAKEKNPNVSLPNRGIDACLFLLNKSEHFTIYQLIGKVLGHDNIYSFSNLHLFTSLTNDKNAPLTLEEVRYKTLINDSFLDSIKIHFFKQYEKLKEKDPPLRKLLNQERHLLMFEATHNIYQYFGNEEVLDSDLETLESFSNALDLKCFKPFLYDFQSGNYSKMFTEKNSALLKVLTQSPFTQYEPLRKKVFNWVLTLLDQNVESIIKKVSDKSIDYNDFIDLKFLLRRAGLLNSNYLICSKMQNALQALYDEGFEAIRKKINAEELIFPNKEAQEKIKNNNKIKLQKINEFHIFYTAQVKELLLLNEARSIRLEKLLKKRSGSDEYNRILRLLRTENFIVVHKFYEFLDSHDTWKTILDFPESEIEGKGKSRIHQFILSKSVSGHQRSRYLRDFLFEIGRGPDPALLAYLWVKNFVSYSDKNTDLTLSRKTEMIFDCMKEIISTSALNPTKLGSFLCIKDGDNAPILVHDKNSYDLSELTNTDWNSEANSRFLQFLDGMLDQSGSYKLSIMELYRDDNSKLWQDLYSIKKDKKLEKFCDFLSQDFNRAIFLRLSYHNDNGEEFIQGVAGFYFYSQNPLEWNLNETKYLILLKASLSQFVEKHHKSNEFRDWLWGESNRKLAFLSGHGKHMLQEIATRERDVFLPIVLNLEHLQLIILLNQSLSYKSGKENIKDIFNKFYNVKGSKTIDINYFDRLKTMADLIFSMKEIESIVDYDFVPDYAGKTLSFAFNEAILNLICFEIILNAKKNRWLYMAEDKDTDVLKKNRLRVDFNVVGNNPNRKLKIIITNTGPGLAENRFDDLNIPGNLSIKRLDTAISGIALLKNLIYKILDDSYIFFEQGELTTESGMVEFVCTITLKEMVND